MKKLSVIIPILLLTVSCGKNGHNGHDGLAGHNGMNGVDGVAGAKGDQGIKGDKGDKGDTGAVGAQGIQGTAGVAGVTSIKFCPNLTDSYGTQYSEYGLCVDNKIYAVYWSNNQAFMTRLSNGNYTTTTPFGNCTFTVQDCTVTQL
jgi:hypothetical protein